MKRVVVTGMGVVSPLGVGVENNWKRLISGKSGVVRVQEFADKGISSHVAGVVPSKASDPEYGYDIGDFIESKAIKRTSRFMGLGVAAADQAIEDSGFKNIAGFNPDRVGIVIGSGIGALDVLEDNCVTLHVHGPKRVSPFFIPIALVNMVTGIVSIRHGLTGPNDSPVGACATGGHAVITAVRMINCGEVDIVVAGSSEAAVCPIGTAGFASMKALSTAFNDRPAEASRPWDKERDGFVIGEGAGILILEEYEHARNRGAKIYAEVLGYGQTSDAYHVAAPHPDGVGAAKTITNALRQAGVAAEKIGYINAHGTSTPLGDAVEVVAIKRVFGDHAYNLAISSTKSAIGHLLGASGSVEAIYSILSLRTGILPPTLNLRNPSPDCDLNFVPLESQTRKLDYVLSNAFGFGGSNTSLLFAKV